MATTIIITMGRSLWCYYQWRVADEGPNTSLLNEDIVSETWRQHKVDENIITHDASHADNVRTKEDHRQNKNIVRSKEGSKKRDASSFGTFKVGRYTRCDGYIFNASDIIEDTGDAYIVPHGNHYHYILRVSYQPANWPRRSLSSGRWPIKGPTYRRTNNNSASSDVDRWPYPNNQGRLYEQWTQLITERDDSPSQSMRHW